MLPPPPAWTVGEQLAATAPAAPPPVAPGVDNPSLLDKLISSRLVLIGVGGIGGLLIGGPIGGLIGAAIGAAIQFGGEAAIARASGVGRTY